MQFYHEAALILDDIDAKKGSVKGLCMKQAALNKKPGIAKRYLAVVIQVLKLRPTLLLVLEKSKLLTLEPNLFIPPGSKASTTELDEVERPSGSAAAVLKSLKSADVKGKGKAAQGGKADKPAWKNKWVKRTPTPLNLACVMVHDLLFAKRGVTLPKAHKVAKTLEQHAERLKAEKEKEKKRRHLASDAQLETPLPDQLASSISTMGKQAKEAQMAARFEESNPLEHEEGHIRWLRINTLKWTVEEAVEWFEGERWEWVQTGVDDMLELSSVKSKVFALDDHIEPLLAVPSATVLPSLPAFQDGRLIAQDKASCFPAWVLLKDLIPMPAGSEDGEDAPAPPVAARERPLRILDATAAPGNKTTMLSALLEEIEPTYEDKEGNIIRGKGKVIGVERDRGRFGILKEMVHKAGCSNVTLMNMDFLSIEPTDDKVKYVSHILVDPSCSGSGIPNRKRLSHLTDEAGSAETDEADLQRVKKLSGFQVAILSHALRFRGAEKVTYSTCSIHAEENEAVVLRILAKKEFQQAGWKLADREDVIPGWERRGDVAACDGDQETADKMIRCNGEEDGMNGFFVACFVRDPSNINLDDDAPAAAAGKGGAGGKGKGKRAREDTKVAAAGASAEEGAAEEQEQEADESPAKKTKSSSISSGPGKNARKKLRRQSGGGGGGAGGGGN